MRWIAALSLCAVLMACAPVENAPGPIARVDQSDIAPTPPAPEDSCGLEERKYMIGLTQAEIDPSELPAAYRFVCPECMVTQDYAPARLNLHTSTEGRVASLRCG